MNTTRKKRRADPKDRKQEILTSAIAISMRFGYHNITRDDIAVRLGISKSLITNYYSMDKLRKAIIKAAIKFEILPIVAQVIAINDPQSKNIPRGLKNKAIEFLAN